MSAFFEGRLSDSPYIEMVWRGHVEQDYAPVCPADVRCKQVQISAEGLEFLVIKFWLGVYMPHLPAHKRL